MGGERCTFKLKKFIIDLQFSKSRTQFEYSLQVLLLKTNITFYDKMGANNNILKIYWTRSVLFFCTTSSHISALKFVPCAKMKHVFKQ